MKQTHFLILLLLLFQACKKQTEQVVKDPDVYYTCSMHPQVHEDKPGNCPICHMELIPVKITNNENEGEIELNDQQIQLGNITTDTLRKSGIGAQMVLTATVNFNQQSENAISSKIGGRIEKLYFKNIGDYITKGTKLYDLYSEELNNAKQEYLMTLEQREHLNNSVIDFDHLVQAAKNKLVLWGMSEAQIKQLSENKKATPLTSFFSNSSGVITELEINEGDYVMEGGPILKLTDLSTLWVEAQVYASQIASIDKNGKAIVQFPDFAGQEITGKIEFVNPEINPNTRINLVRVTIPNRGNLFKPGMPAYVIVKNRTHNSLSLPSDAVIRDNKGSSVWVQTEVHKFKNVMVETGLESNDMIEITSGLTEGDIVVVSGAYLLNSEYIFKTGANPMEGMDMSTGKM